MLIVIDNYDSFTWNLVQYLGELGADPRVVRNDEMDVDRLARLGPSRLVISPGPCTPAEAGISVECVRRFAGEVPILGVCLGHQAIGAAFGARIVRAREPVHGKLSAVRHGGTGLFAGLASPLTVTRYHSLVVDPESLPPELEVIAWSGRSAGGDEAPVTSSAGGSTALPGERGAPAAAEAEIQAIGHRELPIWGVQFHPESVASEGGRELLANFLSVAPGA